LFNSPTDELPTGTLYISYKYEKSNNFYILTLPILLSVLIFWSINNNNWYISAIQNKLDSWSQNSRYSNDIPKKLQIN